MGVRRGALWRHRLALRSTIDARPARVGLVATLRGADPSFATWLRHHLDCGIERLYLVFDAPVEDRAAIELAGRDARVRCIENDASHRALVRALPGYAQLEPLLDEVVVARQMLNAGRVVGEARADGLEWLLHLDGDELIAPYTSGVSVPRYLASVPSAIDEVIFPNFEAVPEREEISDPFREVTLFKKSPYYLRYKEFEQLLTAWDGPGTRFKLFNAYITGKSALRLADVDAPLLPRSVHHFLPLRFTANVHIEDGGGPAIFHYPHCGMSRFLARFTGVNAKRRNTYGEEGLGEDLYGEAERLVRASRLEELPALYRRLVMLDVEGLKEKLDRLGLLIRLAPLAP